MKFARNPSLTERASNFSHRNRLIGIGAIVLVAALLGGGPFWWGVWNPEPQGSSTSRPTPISELADFRAAVRDLDAQEPQALIRARDEFRRLSLEHPGSAWPRLYLGVALERLSELPGANRNQNSPNKTLAEAAERDGYEAALQQRIAEDPRSATLLTLQAKRILDQTTDPNRYQKAAPLLEKAISVAPDRIPVLISITAIEREAGQWERAARHLKHAIEIAEKRLKLPAATVNPWRRNYLQILTLGADQLLAHQASVEGSDRLASVLDEIESYALALDHRWVEGPLEGQPTTMRAYYHHYYTGLVAAGRATLAGLAGRQADASAGLARAKHHFDAASRVELIGEESRKDARARLADLEARSRSILRKPELPQATPDPAGG